MNSQYFRLINNNALDALKKLPDNSVHCCVTSPPYWSLRDYGKGNQIGKELTLQKYIISLLDVFWELKRVIRDDGSLWLNVGDGYCGAGHLDDGTDPDFPLGKNGQYLALNNKIEGYKNKDLLGIPWQLSQALQKPKIKCGCCGQNDYWEKWGHLVDGKICPFCKKIVDYKISEKGWYFRSDVIWYKPNSYPEKVKDRPVKSHEYLFLLSKKKTYYFDFYAIRQKVKEHLKDNSARKFVKKNTIWESGISTFRGAHFATFPPKLIEPCILASTSSKGCCSSCGAPWKRIVDIKKVSFKNRSKKVTDYRSVGWEPTCICKNNEPVPSIILDCFNGAGSTGVAALTNSRNYIGIEINPEYINISRNRLNEIDPLGIKDKS